MTLTRFPLLLCILGVALALPVRAELPPLIPRAMFFGNPERAYPQLSPDGRQLAWLAADTNNVLQIWAQTLGEDDSRIVTADKKRGIRFYAWARNSRMLLYLQDADGDENFQVHGVDLDSGNVRNFTALQGVKAELVATDKKHPDEILVALNARDRATFDVHRLDLRTGALVLDTQNPGDVVQWVEDAKFQIRGAVVQTPDGGTEIRIRKSVKAPWQTLLKVGMEEILEFIGFSGDGRSVYLRTSVGRNTAALVKRNIANGKEEVLADNPEVDAGEVVMNPDSHVVEAVAFSPGRQSWKVLDRAVKEDFDGIARLYDGDFSLITRNDDDDVWLVTFVADRSSVRYYRWDRKTKRGTFLFSARPKLDALTLAPMKAVSFPARDGLMLHGYLTLPVGVEARGLPMVLNPHGGPWARDEWGYNPYVQLYANRGYAVLQVNFRGSTGYGKAHLNAGNRQWGLKMHDDLIDAVNWAVKQGLADPKRVGISGGSYGGYCALAAVTYTPEVFACSVDIVGPSNLKTLIQSIPPYWKPLRALFDKRIGNIDDPADAELIRKASPLFLADRIVRPLLIGQGANDPRVKQAEAEQIVAAIEKNRGKVVYVLYTDEGHGWARPENRIDWICREERFLADHLGGRCEEVPSDRHPGSSAVVRVVGNE